MHTRIKRNMETWKNCNILSHFAFIIFIRGITYRVVFNIWKIRFLVYIVLAAADIEIF